VTQVAAYLNRHSENVAELLLLGRSELGDLEAAQDDLDRALEDLSELVEREVDLIRSDADREGELAEYERIARLRDLYGELGSTTARLLVLIDQARTDEAAGLFRDAVENGFSADLDREISAALADEEGELAIIRDHSARLRSRLVMLVLGVSVFTLLVMGAAGARLSRALTTGIEVVIAGTQAIGEGNFSHRIRDDQPKEFST
jgi:methyl-accepting chemotaxis protein